jgi:hypothetical protein
MNTHKAFEGWWQGYFEDDTKNDKVSAKDAWYACLELMQGESLDLTPRTPEQQARVLEYVQELKSKGWNYGNKQ